MDTPPPAPPHRRWFRRLLLGTALVVAAAAVLVFFAPRIVAGTALRHRVTAAAGAYVDGTLTVDAMTLSWLRPVELTGVTVTDPAGVKTIEAAAVRTDKSLFGLALAGGDYGGVTVESPVVHVVVDGDSSNLERVLAKVLAPDDTPAGPDRSGLVLHVTGGRVILSDAAVPGDHVLDPVTATVTMPKSRAEPISVTASLTAPDPSRPGAVAAEFSTGEMLAAAVTCDAVPLERFAPLVRRFAHGTTAAGRLGADLKLAKAAGPGGAVTASGWAAVDDLAAAGGWSGGGPVALAKLKAMAPKVTLAGGVLAVTDATLTCDAGRVTATAEVSTSDPIGELFSTPGLALDADLDVAKLAAVAPGLLRLKPGTSLTDGRVTAKVVSRTVAGGTEWDGGVTATALRGVRAGKPLGWDAPLKVGFRGHLRASDGLPVFDKLECEADFVGLAGRGSAEQFLVMANVDLDRLAARLSEFTDLGGATLGGAGRVTVKIDPAAGGTFQASASAEVDNFRYADAAGRAVTEPKLAVTAAAGGRHAVREPLRIDAFSASVTAGPDKLTADLAAPVPDLKTLRTGAVKLALDGDLGRWRGRVGSFASVPADWLVGGAGPVRLTVGVTPAAYTVTDATADLTNARFHGAGVALDEPTLAVKAGASWDRAAGTLALTDVTVHGPTLVLTTPRADVAFPPTGTTVATTAKLTANLNRMQSMLKMAADPAGAVNGLAVGTLTVTPAGPATGFDADFRVTDVIYGNPASPTWREPWVTVAAKGTYDPAADAVTLPTLAVARDGVSVAGRAALSQLSAAKQLDTAGTLTYDLAKLEPQLRELIGGTVTARGQGSKPFRAAGPLSDPAALTAQGGLGWDQVKAFGFDVGPAEMTATAAGGKLAVTPVTAQFGGGTVRAEPTVDLAAPGYPLTLTPGVLVDNAKLTPEACAAAVGYALPAFANAAQADGRVSVELGENRVPLLDAKSGTAHGVVTVHTASVSAGPLVSQVAAALGATQTSMTLTKEQKVPVRLEAGRVHHERFAVLIGQTEVVSSGSVGLDKTVRLTLDMPVPPKLLDGPLRNNPRVREALAKQRIQVPVTGTLSKPVLDNRAMTAKVAELMKGVGRDVLGDVAGGFQDKLRQELEKKLAPRKP